MTSHSPAVLSRINPREVRYCRCDPQTRISTIKTIKMPPALDEEAKFVRGAVLAYAEALSREMGQQVEPTKLVAPMLARFLASDRGFRSARRPVPRSRAPNPQPTPPPREPAD